jgi:hypothetical protein
MPTLKRQMGTESTGAKRIHACRPAMAQQQGPLEEEIRD